MLRSLFGRTAVTVIASMLLLQIFTLAVTGWLLMWPVVKTSVDDLAALMVLSAKTWVELPPVTRPDFAVELATHHQLYVREVAQPTSGATSYLPYVLLLESALSRRLGEPVTIRAARFTLGGAENAGITPNGTTAVPRQGYQVDIPMAGHWLRFSFDRARIGTRPPVALLLIVVGAVAISLGAGLLIARRLSRPLEKLAQATERVAAGHVPPALPEQGPRELARLAARFNHMAQEVQRLLEQRTVLLTGVSHDLRSPLARLRMALELLPRAQADGDGGEARIAQMERELETMNRLIGECLDIGRGIQAQPAQPLCLVTLLRDIATSTASPRLRCELPEHCTLAVAEGALRRVVGNLLDNALRYAPEGEITLFLACPEYPAGQARIHICDHGPGIPPAQLETVFAPFMRLEGSRSVERGGSGLGLAIVREICAAQGWRVRLHPRRDGGLCAELELPAAPVL